MDDLTLLIDAWPVTDPGLVKTYNEDFVAVYEPDDPQLLAYAGSLYVVADGTGEASSGQVASRYAALKIIGEYYKSAEVDPGVRLRRAFQTVNTDLYLYIEQNPEIRKVSTSVCALAIRGEQFHIASVGDCRVYLVRRAQIMQMTRDHTLVAGMVEQRAISPEEAREHPQRGVLLRSLGTQPTVEVDLFDGRLAPDDRMVLCSNGLTRHVDGQELISLAVESQPTSAAERMVALAKERGGRDNITAVVLGARMGIPTPRTPLPFAWDGREPSLGDVAADRFAQAPRPPAAPPTPYAPPAQPLQHPTQPVMPQQQQPPQQPQQQQQPAYYPYMPPPRDAPESTTQVHERPPFSQPPMQPSPYGMEPIPQPGQPKTYRPPDAGRPPGGLDLSGGAGSRNILIGLLAVIVLAVAGVVAAVTLLPLLTGGRAGGEAAEGGGLPVEVITTTPDSGLVLSPPAPPTAGEAVTPVPTQQLVPPGMVLVEAGEFLRGASEEEITQAVRNCIQEGGGACPIELFDDATPQTNVTLGAFYLDRTEVTNAQYALCVAAGTCDPPVDTTRYDDPAYANHPVTNVTWAQAANYCASVGKRLPTEAEWEKAARGVEGRIWPWGDQWEPGKANTLAAQLGGPSTVESFAGDVSPFGVIGLAGNVSEWVQDWYQGNYENLALVDPQGPLAQPGDEPIKVARGGSYQSRSDQARAGMRLDVNSGNSADWLGFRCAASLTATVPAAPVGAATPGGTTTTTTPEATGTSAPAPTGGTTPTG